MRAPRRRACRSVDRKSTRLNSSHVEISYAVFCLIRRAPGPTLFPYTTLFRSRSGGAGRASSARSNGSWRVEPMIDRTAARIHRWLAFVLALALCAKTIAPADARAAASRVPERRSEEHTSELQSRRDLVCRLLLDTPRARTYPLSLHDALPISEWWSWPRFKRAVERIMEG